MKLGIDIDGVMADFTQAFTRLAFDLGVPGADKVVTQATQPTWEFHFGVSRVWNEINASYNWWMTMPPLVSASEIANLNKVIKVHDVYFITARGATKGFHAAKQTELWLQSIGVDAHHAHVLTAHGTKGQLCNALGVTDMLDDNVPNLDDLRAHGVTAWCRQWLYNTGQELPCGSLDDFLYASGAMGEVL